MIILSVDTVSYIKIREWLYERDIETWSILLLVSSSGELPKPDELIPDDARVADFRFVGYDDEISSSDKFDSLIQDVLERTKKMPNIESYYIFKDDALGLTFKFDLAEMGF